MRSILFTILRYDGWVLDHLLQPVADWLADWWSCYQLAAFLLTGDVLINMVLVVLMRVFMLLLSLPLMMPPLLRAYYFAAHPPSMMPVDRYIWWAFRPAAVLFIIFDFVLPGRLERSDLLLITIQVLQFFGTGFLGCRPRPPKRHEANLWRWKPA